jgi:hypothetical protein
MMNGMPEHPQTGTATMRDSSVLWVYDVARMRYMGFAMVTWTLQLVLVVLAASS